MHVHVQVHVQSQPVIFWADLPPGVRTVKSTGVGYGGSDTILRFGR